MCWISFLLFDHIACVFVCVCVCISRLCVEIFHDKGQQFKTKLCSLSEAHIYRLMNPLAWTQKLTYQINSSRPFLSKVKARINLRSGSPAAIVYFSISWQEVIDLDVFCFCLPHLIVFFTLYHTFIRTAKLSDYTMKWQNVHVCCVAALIGREGCP